MHSMSLPKTPLQCVRARVAAAAIVVVSALSTAAPAHAQSTLLNVSYDVAREYYKDYNPVFARYWKQKTGETVTINQSHGGSSAQARAVADGLEADVVTMNQATDVDLLAQRGLVVTDWVKRFPNGAAPNYSTMVFLVRKGNPKAIRDWDDLVKPGVAVVIPNPKTAGNGRYTYLAAWGYALKKPGGSDAKAKEFVTALFRNVPVLDTGGRGATNTFAQRCIGDALVTFENEVFLIQKELGADKVEIVYPSQSIRADNPVAINEKVVDRKGTRKQAQAYLEYLYSDEAQEIAAKYHYRPAVASVAKKYASTFKPLTLITVDEVFGGWQAAQKAHFADGGNFDQIYSK
jgi:sulfate transport system substrate-binding protein